MYGHRDCTQAKSSQVYKQPLKLTARQIPWKAGNTYAQSPILFADTVSLHPSHKINVPPNRKAILQCITLSEWTSVPQPVSLNLSLICLVLLWALRNNYVLSLLSCERLACTEPDHIRARVNVRGLKNVCGRQWWSQIFFFAIYCPLLESVQLFPLSFGLWRRTGILHRNMNLTLWPVRCFPLSERHH